MFFCSQNVSILVWFNLQSIQKHLLKALLLQVGQNYEVKTSKIGGLNLPDFFSLKSILLSML
jgi:hypothetical protein